MLRSIWTIEYGVASDCGFSDRKNPLNYQLPIVLTAPNPKTCIPEIQQGLEPSFSNVQSTRPTPPPQTADPRPAKPTAWSPPSHMNPSHVSVQLTRAPAPFIQDTSIPQTVQAPIPPLACCAETPPATARGYGAIGDGRDQFHSSAPGTGMRFSATMLPAVYVVCTRQWMAFRVDMLPILLSLCDATCIRCGVHTADHHLQQLRGTVRHTVIFRIILCSNSFARSTS